MARIAYVNGRYLPHADARVHVEDRGFQFADGVYEVCEVLGGRMVDERRHMQRLTRSLSELGMALPMPLTALGMVLRETIRRNRVRFLAVRWQQGGGWPTPTPGRGGVSVGRAFAWPSR